MYRMMSMMSVLLLAMAVGACAKSTATNGAADNTASAKAKESTMTESAQATEKTTVAGLQMDDTVTGEGAEAVSGKRVTVHYTGKLTDGTKFDSSLDRSAPFTFALGAGQVIRGWDQGVVGMKVGGKRTLTIPGNLAYGERGVPGTIPANATLVFDVELLAVE
jgi:FKBP-type peptidyl-prolyl cis-trans isomerase FkpA